MKIRSLSQQDLSMAVETMASSFRNDDLYRYFIPDDNRRNRFLESFMKFRLKFGLKHGEVYVTDDCNGVAVWIAPGHEMTLKDLVFYGGISALFKCKKEERQRIMAFNNHASQIMKSCIRQPYWHLLPICVSPDFQGKGYGGSLLAYGLKRIDGDAKPCFLETQSLKNKLIYEKFRFTCMSETPIKGTNGNHFGMVYQQDKSYPDFF